MRSGDYEVRENIVSTSEMVEYMMEFYTPVIDEEENLHVQSFYGEKGEEVSDYYISTNLISPSVIEITSAGFSNNKVSHQRIDLKDKTMVIFQEEEGNKGYDFFYIVPDYIPKIKVTDQVYFITSFEKSKNNPLVAAESRYIHLLKAYEHYLSMN